MPFTHLPVENDAPDEPKNQFVISINNVCRSDIHQFNLEYEQADRQISLQQHFQDASSPPTLNNWVLSPYFQLVNQ